MAKTKSLEDLDLWLILGSPRGRLRNALSRALREFEAEKPLSVVSLELYIRPEKDLPRLEGGAWNLAHEDAIDWTHLQEDLKDLSDTGEVVVICDDRAAGCRALLEACKRMIVCSSTELGCFKDCILSRVTLEDYTRRIWPTYKQRVSRLWDWLAEDANLLRKASMLDEDDFREKSTRDVMDNFARKHLEELLDSRAGNVGSVKMLEKKEIGKWKGRIYEAPERNQRKFQQVRKDVLYAFEMEARSFASSMTKQLLSGSMKDAEVALKALDAYRLSLHSMSHEERAKWASVICTREVGPQGQVLSVEILRWAWKRLRELRDDEVSPELGQARVLQVLEAAESADELTPFARLLGPENAVLEGVCAAVDNVIQFGRLFFLRQRMWDAQPEITLELAKLLLEHKHWLLQSLGTRFCAQLLDADPARYQVCFRDLTRNRESPPFALILARALLNVAGPVFGPAAVDFEKDQEVEALWKGEWYSARFLKHDLERHEIEIEWKTQVEASERRQWCCEGWVRSLRAKKDPGSGYDYWKWLRDRHLVDASALRKLLNRAPEHCLHLIQEPRLVESLRSLLHQALHRGLLHLSAEASACLSRLLRYGPSETIMVGGGHDLRDVQSLILGLSELGSKESLGEATNYFTTLNWSAQWRQDDAPAAWKPRCPLSPPVRAPGKTPAAPRAEDPAVRVLELLELQKELQQEQQLRSAAQQQQLKAEEELKSSKEMIARLLEEKKEMAQRLQDLDAERPDATALGRSERPAATAALSGTAGTEEAAGDAEENDWMLKADPDTLTLADAEGFISRIATRRDNVRVLRSSLCGGLRQLGEKLYASPVHFIEELLQNADDCSYGSEIEPSFKIEATQSACRFSYNELGFRAKDVLSLCSLAVSTKTFGDFLGHKGVGFKSVFACSNAPCIVSGKFRFKFQVPGIDELSYITPRCLDDVHGPYGLGTEGTQIWLPFRPELSGNQDFLEKLRCAVDPLVLLGLRQLRRLSFQMEGETQVAAHLTKTAVEDFREIKTWKACLRINDQDHLYRLFSYGAGKAVLAFPAAPGPELPVCAGLPCARVGHRFLLQANWQLTTSREAVRESVENYQLRSEAAKLFCVAARHPDILPHLALFLPATGPGTPPFWQTFAEELLHELRLVLPELGLGLGATATLRLPEERIMALVEPQVFVAAGLELVQDEAAQLVMQKCGIPALGIADLFACFPHFETLGIVKPESWWAELFQLLLENAGKPQLEELVKRQPIWCLRGSGRRCCLPENGEIVFCSVPTSFSKSWRSQVVFLDTHSTAELRFALLTVAKTWDATVMAAAVLYCHLELRRDELKVDEALRGLLWRDLDFLKNVWDELRQLPVEVPAAPGEMALVPSDHGASTACLTTVPTVLGCKVPLVTGCGFGSASPVALPYGDVMVVSEAIAWEDFLLKLGCRAPVLDARSCPLGTFILPPLAEMLCVSSQMKNVLCALPARSLQWFQENVSMCAVSGQIVPLNALVAEGLLRNLPKVPEGLEVVPVPREMEDLAASLGICVRQDVDMCWLILRSLCDAGVRSVGPYVENLAMLQSLRGDASASDLPKNQAILFLPSSSNAEPSFAALSEIYVTQEFGTETMPKDEEEAKVLEMGFEELRQFLGRSVISCTHNVAYWSFSSELKLMGCAERPSVAEALQALQRAAQEPRFRQRIGRSSVKDRGELLNDHGLEVMLSLYRLLELALSAVEDVPSWDWKERLTPTRVLQPAAALTAACSMHGPLPIVTWEGRLVTGGSSEVWACRSSWFLDSVLDAAPICFIHRDIAEHCPRLVAASSWFYVEGRTTIVWQQSNNNPEKELTEVSEAFSEVLRRQIQVVSCNWIALELFFSPKVEPKETEWFSDVPGLIKERLRAQPSFAMIGGVLVLATHFVKEAAERAALAAAALALALQEMGKTRQDAEALARETCEKIRSFTSERFWEASSSQSHAGYNIRQVRSTEVLLPSGIGEEATLPGLMGSFGAVEQYEDDEEANAMRLRGCPGERRDHELFTDALGRILSDHGTVSYRKTAAPANAAEILAVKEQQKRVGERAEHFYSCFLESVFGDAYKPTRDWVSSARLCVYPGRGTDDACGFDFVVLDTAQRIVPCQGKRSVRCFIEVKGSAGDFNGMFCLSANEQRKRDQIAASKSDGNAYVIAVVDNLESLEFASIRHFIWSDDPQLLRLEADSFLARVDPAAGRAVAGRAAPAAAPAAAAAAAAPAKRETPVATVNIPAAKVGLVIGKGGATVKWMSQESGAQIQVVDGNTPGLANLKIEGSKAQIHHAKQLIQEVVYSQSSQWDARSGRVWKGNGSASSVWGPHGSAGSSQGWQ